jgi:hypothetical protein
VSRIRSRLSYANVVASLALFVALGGSSYAAVKITGKQIRDGSLTGADIKNGSVGARDLKPGAAGQPGPAGSQGPQGPQGLQGPAGDPASVPAYGATAGRTVFGYPDFTLAKTLPAGKYVLHASVDIQGYGSTSGYMGGISVVDCSIPGFKTASYYLSPNGTYGSQMESLSLNSTVDHPGGALTLRCERSWNDAVVLDASLTAVKVGSLG